MLSIDVFIFYGIGAFVKWLIHLSSLFSLYYICSLDYITLECFGFTHHFSTINNKTNDVHLNATPLCHCWLNICSKGRKLQSYSVGFLRSFSTKSPCSKLIQISFKGYYTIPFAFIIRRQYLLYIVKFLRLIKNWMFKFVSLLKYKSQMTGNKLCKPAQRCGADLHIICYPSSDVYTSINWQN